MVELALIKQSLGITGTTNNALLSRLILVATKMIENYCKRSFTLSEYANEEYRGSGTRFLNLKNYPIIEVVKVEENEGLIENPVWIDISQYVYSKSLVGQLYLNSGFFKSERDYRVTYSAGYESEDSQDSGSSPVPVDVQHVCIELVSYLYQNRTGQGMKSERVGDLSYTKFDQSGKGLIKDLYLDAILDTYRTPTL